MKITASIISLTMLLLVGCTPSGRDVTGIRNFAVVDEGLYRGGQPTEQGIATLKTRGVRTVINLRDDPNPRERSWVEKAGMKYVNIPASAGRVRAEQIARFLDEIAVAPRPIFVHCYHGCDRTGLKIAAYRMVRQGWSRQETLRDLYAHGYHWLWFPGIGRYVNTFEAAGYRTSSASAY